MFMSDRKLPIIRSLMGHTACSDNLLETAANAIPMAHGNLVL